MKNTAVVFTNSYEHPSLKFCSLEMCGFLCISDVKVDEDEWIAEDEQELVAE